MDEIEREIEEIQNGESSISIERLVSERIEEVLSYISFSTYKEGQKSRKIGVIETIKGVLTDKSFCKRLCTPRYVFLLAEIRKNTQSKKISEGLLEVSYEAYANGIKSLLEFSPEETLGVIVQARNMCYLEAVLESGDSQHVVDLFPCFFALSGENFHKWIKFLISKNFVDMVFRSLSRQRSMQKETQNFTKLIYLLISFSGTIFKRDFPADIGVDYSFFYREIEKRASAILDIVFIDSDAVNRLSALHAIKEMIKVLEYLQKDPNPFHFFFRYVAESQILRALKNSTYLPDTQIKIILLINLISRTVRYKSASLREFFITSKILPDLIRFLYQTTTYTVTNEMCTLINELVHVDRSFYISAILDICEEVQKQSLKKPIESLSTSQKKNGPTSAVLDCVTPVLHILYKLYCACASESNSQNTKPTEIKTSQKRFTVIGKESAVYQILQALRFFEEDSMRWYRSTRLQEYEKKTSLEYVRAFPDTASNLDQFSRYFPSYLSSVLPEYPLFLL